MIPIILVFLPFVCGIAGYVIGRTSEKGRDLFAVVSTFAELALSVWLLYLVLNGGQGVLLNMEIPYVFSGGLSFRTDGFRGVYSLVTALMWAFTTLFSLEYFREERENLNRYYLFVLMTLGATEGVMLSGDLMTTFVFFEILSLTSCTWVMHEETKEAIDAGYTYLFIAVAGGLVLFMGLVLLQYHTGTLSYAELPGAVSELLSDPETAKNGPALLAAGICILFGFGCKAGMFPVHVWLPKAHPVAPSPASALLSGVLTKVGIYGILMTSLEVLIDHSAFGWIVLIFGTVTMLLGAVLALFSVNLKRTLACSSMSQIGFILTGIGMTILLTAQEGSRWTAASGQAEAAAGEGLSVLGHHAAMAMSGTMLHMVNHSMLKLCLFCAAGVVVMNIHALDLNTIRGWGRNKWLLKIAFFLGVVGIGGVPLFNGYASKTLLHEAITSGIAAAGEGAAITASSAGILSVIEWIFLFSGGCTFAYMLKLFICIFVEKQKDPKKQEAYDRAGKGYMNASSGAVIFLTSVLFVVLGQKPVFCRIADVMTGHAGVLEEYHYLSFECVKGGLISLGIGAALYLFFIRKLLMKDGLYVDLWPEWLDLETALYRPLITSWIPGIAGKVLSIAAENKIIVSIGSFHGKIIREILTDASGEDSEDEKGFRPLGFIRRTGKGFLLVVMVILRAMSMGMDVLIVLMRRSFLRERIVTEETQRHLNAIQRRKSVIQDAYEPIVGNFSFALMLSCIGMLLILGVLMFYII